MSLMFDLDRKSLSLFDPTAFDVEKTQVWSQGHLEFWYGDFQKLSEEAFILQSLSR